MAIPAGIFRPLFALLDRSRDGRFLFSPSRRSGLALGLAVLSACGTRPGGSGGIALVDDVGDTLRVAHPFERVVSLAPATTELIFAIGGGGQLVGRTRWCDFPAEARLVTDVGDGLQPNLEAVLATRPDLVVMYRTATNADVAVRLRAAGVGVTQVGMDRLSDVPRLARLLGRALGREASGDSLAGEFEREIAGLQARAVGRPPGPAVLLLAWDDPPIAIGRLSFQSEILALAGGRNVFDDLEWPSAEVSLEAIVGRNPALVLVTGARPPAAFARPEWQAVPAIREGRILQFDHPGFDRPGPRAPAVIRDLEQLLAGRVR